MMARWNNDIFVNFTSFVIVQSNVLFHQFMVLVSITSVSSVDNK